MDEVDKLLMDLSPLGSMIAIAQLHLRIQGAFHLRPGVQPLVSPDSIGK